MYNRILTYTEDIYKYILDNKSDNITIPQKILSNIDFITEWNLKITISDNNNSKSYLKYISYSENKFINFKYFLNLKDSKLYNPTTIIYTDDSLSTLKNNIFNELSKLYVHWILNRKSYSELERCNFNIINDIFFDDKKILNIISILTNMRLDKLKLISYFQMKYYNNINNTSIRKVYNIYKDNFNQIIDNIDENNLSKY